MPEGFNFFSSMPALAYDIEKNPVYQTLKDKAKKQLSAIPSNALKVIFIADAGSLILRQLTQKDPTRRYKSGQEIIEYFLSKYSVDLVCVFSSKRQSTSLYPSLNKNLFWNISIFANKDKNIDCSRLKELAEILPLPRFEGYQAKSLHQQGLFEPTARGWYLGVHTTTGKDLTMKMSSRILLELLAGKISQEHFGSYVFGKNTNLFKHWLDMGYTLADLKIENAGIDEDDDYVVFKFQKDPAASELEVVS